MGLFGSKYRYKPSDYSNWQMDPMAIDQQDLRGSGGATGGGMIRGDTAVQKEYQPNLREGGNRIDGRDALSLILASVSDAMARNRGYEANASDNVWAPRMNAMQMAREAQAAQQKYQQSVQALTAAGYPLEQAQAMAMGVLKPSDVKPDRMMTKSGDIVAFGNDGQPQTAYRETAPDLLPVQGAGVFAMDRHTGQPFGGSGPTVGTIEDGHRFKGGNPGDPNSWEPVGVGGGTGNGAGSFRTAPRFRR